MKQWTPFPRLVRCGTGVFSFLLSACVCLVSTPARAGDGATEALELRLHAERAIAAERTTGQPGLAEAMTGMLPGLLMEYLASRDETIALDVVDAAVVRNEMVAAKLMNDPGVAWALDVFAGPGTGHEHELRTAMANLADFQGTRAERGVERVMAAAVDVYEKQVQRDLTRADKLQELHAELEARKAEVMLAKATDRADHVERFVEKQAEQVAEKAEHQTEKQVEKIQQAVEKQAEKQAEKIEKEAEKVEQQAEKEAEQVEKEADKQDQAAEKETEKQQKEPQEPKDDKKGEKKEKKD